MPSEMAVGEQLRRAAAAPKAAAAAEQEQLACPRCDSMNTKFCYYNNYNFSQPRHFCKACRRYWTHGGTLRDIPVGGGSRKNAKRPRAAAAPSPPFPSQFAGAPPAAPSFTSLLSSTQGPAGFLALGGFDFGLGLSENLGFGLGRGVWPFGGEGGAPRAAWQAECGGERQVHHGMVGGVVGDFCSWASEPVISAPGTGMK